MWKGWWGGILSKGGWAEMGGMLFSEEGVKRVEFGERTE